eukprot:CAMPEP_0194519746 /NCGR_PEP_ID=MMETSP0253-20130528/53484_1 /TAXON_ID=2966 /ORGANISM="Noctiluca scintillans" /LENGTH=39 /DNA_ID= /DNA_START= /DNA_END= /DNA_ORIENTATION=
MTFALSTSDRKHQRETPSSPDLQSISLALAASPRSGLPL